MPGAGYHSRTVRSTVVWSVICGLAGGLLLVAGARWLTPIPIASAIADAGWTGRTPAWFTTRGFQGAEVEATTGRQFSWTAARARLVVPNLPRAATHRVSIEISAIRFDDAPLPRVRVTVDGDLGATVQTTTTTQWVVVDVPPRAMPGVTIGIEPSDTFVPGNGDSRALGAIVWDVRLEPVGARFRPSWTVMGLTAIAVAMFVAGAVLCGLSPAVAAVLSTATTIGLAGLLLVDAAFLGPDVWRLLHIGVGTLAIGVFIALLRTRWPVVLGLPEWAAAVGIVLSLGALKLAVFTHPQIALTDAFFQVHRAQAVQRGEYFFTSVTPAPSFEFPYAVLLYLAAMPFWSWFPTKLEIANLLRGLSLGADALVGLALYAVTRRQWRSAPAALLCAALWMMTRAPALALGHANLTNLFGQGLFGVAIGCVAWMAASARVTTPAVIATTAALTLAFLSHFSTLTTGIVLVSAVSAACLTAGGRDLRRVGVAIGASLAAAVSISYAVYYWHFNELYVKTFTRIASGVDEASTTSMVAPPAIKFERWITEDQFSNDYGLPGLALFVSAALGLAWLVRDRPREGLTLVLVAWGLVWLTLSALGILTSVELRANLAAAPMFVCLAAYGLWLLASHSPFGRAVAAAGVAAIAADGVRVWLFWLMHA